MALKVLRVVEVVAILVGVYVGLKTLKVIETQTETLVRQAEAMQKMAKTDLIDSSLGWQLRLSPKVDWGKPKFSFGREISVELSPSLEGEIQRHSIIAAIPFEIREEDGKVYVSNVDLNVVPCASGVPLKLHNHRNHNTEKERKNNYNGLFTDAFISKYSRYPLFVWRNIDDNPEIYRELVESDDTYIVVSRFIVSSAVSVQLSKITSPGFFVTWDPIKVPVVDDEVKVAPPFSKWKKIYGWFKVSDGHFESIPMPEGCEPDTLWRKYDNFREIRESARIEGGTD